MRRRVDMRPKGMMLATMLLATLTATADDGRLVINELMQSNIDCLTDDLNEFPDSWVELYNAGTAVVDMGDYCVGITEDASEAYRLPAKKLAAGAHALVYCDKVGSGMHTGFRLESGKGCSVYLFRNGQLADRVEGLKKQPAPNTAYGRQTDGADTWGYELTPTPGEANGGGVCDHDRVLGDPVFSERGRTTAGDLNLTLTLSVPEGTPKDAQIRFTTNGEEPTTRSSLYVTPIAIRSTTVVRAKLFCQGWLSPRSVAESFIKHPRQLTLPVVSIATNDAYLNDSKMGIIANNSSDHRTDWRRPVNIEFFFGDGEQSAVNQLCETRVAGAASRGQVRKSLAIYANKRFGTKRFVHEFFPDQKPGLTEFKSLVLRNAGNDFDYLYMRDAIVQRVMASHTDLDWQAWRPAIVYINGKYQGMLNIRERANENNVLTNYGGMEDIDLIENWWDLKEGDWENYRLFEAFYNEHGHSLAEYEEWMDCMEFLNLMVMNLYFDNMDFPGNNIVMWRPREEGGRWRWIAKDADFTMGLYGAQPNYNTLEWLHNPDYDYNHNWGANSYKATRLFRRLMEDEDFKREFIDRTAIYMGDFLNEKGIRAVWDPMYEEIKTEYPSHRNRINPWWPTYSDELNSARRWVKQRTDIFYTQMSNYYKLGGVFPVTVNQGVEDAALAGITFNGVALSDGTFNGKFFKDRRMTLQGNSEGEHVVTGWHVVENYGSSRKESDVEGPLLTMTVPPCIGINITATIADGSTGITTVGRDTTPTATDVYDLNGRKVRQGTRSLEGLPKGVYIVNGKKIIR